MGLLRFFLKNEVSELNKEGVLFQVIGERERLKPDIVALINESERLTAGNSVLTLTVAISYGSRGEIAATARRLAELVANGTLNPAEIDETGSGFIDPHQRRETD